ncbi:MAG: hypothetical protein ACYDDO_00750 [Acidiferrobacterales bacterium]
MTRDSLADKVRTRRSTVPDEGTKVQGSQCGATSTQPRPARMPNDLSDSTGKIIEKLRSDILNRGVNPIAGAHSLAALRDAGMSNRDIAETLQVSTAWISKRLGLLNAPPAVRELIENGELSENDYYRHRRSLAGRTPLRRYQRIPMVTISFESGRVLAELLQLLAERHNASPIRLGPKPTRKEIIEILNHRSSDIRRYFE